jgi:uncharacterized protein YjbI with pentapeptide repeats
MKSRQRGHSELVKRWTREQYPLVGPSPFGHTKTGALDFRGVPFRDGKLEHIAISNADFTSAQFYRLTLVNCTFHNCVFTSAVFLDSVVDACEFHQCDFRQADWRLALIGCHGTDFRRCLFDGVMLKDTGFFNAIFSEIDLRGEDCKHIDFAASGFWDCSFEGALEDVTFRGDYLFPYQEEISGTPRRSGLHNVSFERASLKWVAFTNGCALDNIILPADGCAIMCNVSQLYRIGDILEDSSRKLIVFEEFLKIKSPSWKAQQKTIVSKNDLLDIGGKEVGSDLYSIIKSRLEAQQVSG